MESQNIYVGIPNAYEIKRKLLEAKKLIYVTLHGIIERKTSKSKEIDLLDKGIKILNDISSDLKRLKELLPKIEEEKKKRGKGKKSKKVEGDKERKEETISVPKELEELKKIEEELRRIEEELKKLS